MNWIENQTPSKKKELVYRGMVCPAGKSHSVRWLVYAGEPGLPVLSEGSAIVPHGPHLQHVV